VPVSSREFDDARTVELSFETGAPRQVSSPRAGVVTSNVCAPGDSLASGALVAEVDGRPLVGLATSAPLWRSLDKGDAGRDVKALQDELVRLGYVVRTDGIVGSETLDAVAGLLRSGTAGAGDSDLTRIPADLFVWLPSPRVTAVTCPTAVGATVDAGQSLVGLPEELIGAHLSAMPQDLVAGARTLTLGYSRVDLSALGRVVDAEALELLSKSDEFAQAVMSASGTAPSAAASVALTLPLSVLVVPPVALFGLHDHEGCVASQGHSLPVRVIASELGESFVVSKTGRVPSSVSLTDTPPRCR
jgi:hypothetical protein